MAPKTTSNTEGQEEDISHLGQDLAMAATAPIPVQQPLYTGTWTREELDYTDVLAAEFRAGNLPQVEDKTTLRGFLAMKLGCPVKRISKKYESSGYNGRQQYRSGVVAMTPEESQRRVSRLEELEEKFRASREALRWAKGTRRLTGQDAGRQRGHAALLSTTGSMGRNVSSTGNNSGLQTASRAGLGLGPISTPFASEAIGHLMASSGVASNNLAAATLQGLYNPMMNRAIHATAALPGNVPYSANIAAARSFNNVNAARHLDLSLGLSPSLGQFAALQQLQHLRTMQSLSTGGYMGNIPIHQLRSSLSSYYPQIPARTAAELEDILSASSVRDRTTTAVILAGSSRLDRAASVGAASAAAPPPQAAALRDAVLCPEQDDSLAPAEQLLKRRVQNSLNEHASKRAKGGA